MGSRIEYRICRGWDMLELYNSGLTYKVLKVYKESSPILGDYKDFVEPKVYLVELPCLSYYIEDNTKDKETRGIPKGPYNDIEIRYGKVYYGNEYSTKG